MIIALVCPVRTQKPKVVKTSKIGKQPQLKEIHTRVNNQEVLGIMMAFLNFGNGLNLKP